MGYSKEKQQRLVSALTNVGALAGNNEAGVAGGVKGLGMSLEQTRCEQEATQVRDGLFKVAVMGAFTCGKSTIINALVGAEILPKAVTPTTAILTFIQYGEDESKAKVYMADKVADDGSVIPGECVEMDIDEFKGKYKYTRADEEEVAETGTVRRFAEVKYAVMRCSKRLMEGGVTIIDSPGLEDKKIATDLALNIAEEAQAIIYCLPERGSNSDDRAYIEANFRNCPNNVFFLINKYDLVPVYEREQFLDKVKTDLSRVFTDAEGNFNADLYSRRVFPISALWALCAQTGMIYDQIFQKERELSADERRMMLEGSMFRPFEQKLERFLTTDEKCLAQYQKCFAQMASTWRSARKQVEGYLNAYEADISLDEEKRAECEDIIADIRKSIDITEATFDNSSLKIQNKITEVLSGCSEAIEKSWDEDMAQIAAKIDVGTFEYMLNGLKQINPFGSKEQKKKSMERFVGKFITAVTDHFADKVTDYINDNRVVIDKVVDECQEQLNVSLGNTESLFRDLSKKVTDVSPEVGESDKSWLQLAISTYLGDYSAVTKGALEGKSNWVEYIKKTLFNTIWQVVLISMIDGGLGIIIALAIEFFQGKANQKETVRKILASTKESVVAGIREKLVESRKDLNKAIAVKIGDKKREQTDAMRSRLQDEETRMNEIISARESHSFNLEAEKERFGVILDAMFGEARDAYSVVFGKELCLDEFKGF